MLVVRLGRYLPFKGLRRQTPPILQRLKGLSDEATRYTNKTIPPWQMLRVSCKHPTRVIIWRPTSVQRLLSIKPTRPCLPPLLQPEEIWRNQRLCMPTIPRFRRELLPTSLYLHLQQYARIQKHDPSNPPVVVAQSPSSTQPRVSQSSQQVDRAEHADEAADLD